MKTAIRQLCITLTAFRIFSFTVAICLISLSVQAQLINVGYATDVSISATRVEPYNAKNTLIKIVNLVEIKDSKAGVHLGTTVIGAPGIPKVGVASLPEATAVFSSVTERRANLAKFLSKSLENLEELDVESNHQQTQIFRAVVALASHFNSDSQRTIVILESDFISSGPACDFFKYGHNPKTVMDDFDAIMEAFKEDNGGKWPDLTGAEVYLISPGNTEMAVWSVRFWAKAFYLFGAANVTIRAVF